MMNGETPLVQYDGGAVFERVCPLCRRFVKADDSTNMDKETPNATCSKCGRVRMGFVGWFE